jgi:hypothetical protein
MNSSHGEGCWIQQLYTQSQNALLNLSQSSTQKKSLLVACDAMVSFELEEKVCLTAVLLVDTD